MPRSGDGFRVPAIPPSRRLAGPGPGPGPETGTGTETETGTGTGTENKDGRRKGKRRRPGVPPHRGCRIPLSTPERDIYGEYAITSTR
ncbi:hypothetical protein GCM10017673_42770 [Streptosporangium violaceochromogenes]|nr:hypothetical protein GCM10017673_42770 [Streptosporangium violaceochromogenes]